MFLIYSWKLTIVHTQHAYNFKGYAAHGQQGAKCHATVDKTGAQGISANPFRIQSSSPDPVVFVNGRIASVATGDSGGGCA